MAKTAETALAESKAWNRLLFDLSLDPLTRSLLQWLRAQGLDDKDALVVIGETAVKMIFELDQQNPTAIAEKFIKAFNKRIESGRATIHSPPAQS